MPTVGADTVAISTVATTSSGPVDTSKPSLLLVEDNADVQQYLMAWLQDQY